MNAVKEIPLQCNLSPQFEIWIQNTPPIITFLIFSSFVSSNIKEEYYCSCSYVQNVGCLSLLAHIRFVCLQSLDKSYIMLQRISFRVVYVCQFSSPPICSKGENIKDSLALWLSVNFPYPPSNSDTVTGPQTWYPKLRRVFLVSVREKMALSHEHSSPACSGPFFLLQPIKFWSTFFNERTKKRKRKYERREKFNILFHSLLILFSLLFLFRLISLSACVPCSSQWRIWLWLVNSLPSVAMRRGR
jgi:hypothetical protein